MGCIATASSLPSTMDGASDRKVIGRDPIGYFGSKWNLSEALRGRTLTAIDPDGLVPSKTVVTKKIPSITGDPLSNPTQPGIQITELHEHIGACGQVDWTVKLWKTLPFRPSGSFWVQHVKIEKVKTDCAGKPIVAPYSNGQSSIEYWEAVQISSSGTSFSRRVHIRSSRMTLLESVRRKLHEGNC